MALSAQRLIDMLRDEIPAGSQGGRFDTLALAAVRDAVAYGQARLRERVNVDLWGDGVTTRFPLTGRQVRLMEPSDWTTPTGLNTAGIASPSVAASYSAGTGGALPAGVYLACYAFATARGVTGATAPIATTVAASGTLVRGPVTPPAGASVVDYLSVAAGSGELRSAATGGTGATLALAAVPAATAAAAPVDFTALASLSPDLDHLEIGIAPDGSASAATTTLILGTAAPAGARVRIPYTRTPTIPTDLVTAIGLDDDYLRLATKACLFRLLFLNPRSGDTTDYGNMEKETFAQVDALLGTASGRRGPRVKWVVWQ